MPRPKPSVQLELTGVPKPVLPAPVPASKAAPDRARLGRRSRRKGAAWENELVALLRPVFGEQVRRCFQSRSGQDGCDVEGTPYHIEAKHRRLVNLRSALRQGLADTDGRPVLVVAKDNRSAPFVVMLLADWLQLVAARQAQP